MATADSNTDLELSAAYLCNPAPAAHFVAKSRPAMELWLADAERAHGQGRGGGAVLGDAHTLRFNDSPVLGA